MRLLRWQTIPLVLITACSPVGADRRPAADPPPQLSASEKSAIGMKIWRNECAGTVEGLTTWNAGEEFPSLGIGHFIWYPQGFAGRFHETWPQFVSYAVSHGAPVPDVGRQAHCPWPTREQFRVAFHGTELAGLRRWLSENVTIQTDFIIARSQAALPKILAAAPAGERARIRENYHKVARTPQGIYALIDYVNFKGEGTAPGERYQGRGWGLLQVLGEMRDVPAGPDASREFAAAAKRALSRRISLSPPERGEKRWEAGWHNRCDSYARPL